MRELIERLEGMDARRLSRAGKNVYLPEPWIVFGAADSPLDYLKRGAQYVDPSSEDLMDGKVWTRIVVIQDRGDARKVADTLSGFLRKKFEVTPVQGKWEKGFALAKSNKLLSYAGMSELYKMIEDRLKNYQGNLYAYGMNWGDTEVMKTLSHYGRDTLSQAKMMLKAVEATSDWSEADRADWVSTWGDPQGKRKNWFWSQFKQDGGKKTDDFVKRLSETIMSMEKMSDKWIPFGS